MEILSSLLLLREKQHVAEASCAMVRFYKPLQYINKAVE